MAVGVPVPVARWVRLRRGGPRWIRRDGSHVRVDGSCVPVDGSAHPTTVRGVGVRTVVAHAEPLLLPDEPSLKQGVFNGLCKP